MTSYLRYTCYKTFIIPYKL